MGKVITSAGLNEFVSAGKYDEIKDAPKVVAKEAPPLEVKESKPAADAGEKAPPRTPEEEYLDGIEDDPAVRAQMLKSERFTRAMGKKHVFMMEAKEAAEKAASEAAEAERFAETQFNERRLLEQRLREMEAKAATAPKAEEPPKPEKPDPQKFYDEKGQFKAFEYAEALSTYAATNAVAADRARQVEERRAAEAVEQERIARERVAAARAAHPDYDKVMAADPQVPTIVLQYMTGSEHVGEIAYHLAKNPDYVERINKLHPLKAIAEIGKLEQTFEKPPTAAKPPAAAPKASGAPPPIEPLQTSGSGTVQTDPAKMSYRELRAFERSRQQRK